MAIPKLTLTLRKKISYGVTCLATLIILASYSQFELSTDDVMQWKNLLLTWHLESPLAFYMLYFLCFTLITALCLPGASLLMLAGAGIMNFHLCCILSAAASTLGSTLTMLFTRYHFRTAFEVNYSKKLHDLNTGLQKNEIPFLISLRLAPVLPFVLFNLLAGLTQVRVSTFIWTSFIGMLPGTILFVHFGVEIDQASSLSDLLSKEVLIAFFGLATIPWVLNFLFKSLRKKYIFN